MPLSLNHTITECVMFDVRQDEMMKADPQLHQIGCCNELNAGYAADGYSRATGLGVLVVTHMVGALSALNAVAGELKCCQIGRAHV